MAFVIAADVEIVSKPISMHTDRVRAHLICCLRETDQCFEGLQIGQRIGLYKQRACIGSIPGRTFLQCRLQPLSIGWII